MNKEQIRFFVEKYGPDILSGLASFGVIGTAILSVRAGFKANDILKDGTERTKKEKFKATAKFFVLPAISGLATIASIWGSRKLSATQIASLTAALGYFSANRESLEKRVTSEEVRDARIEAALKKIPAIEETGKGEQICLDGIFGRWFKSTEQDVKSAIDIFNKNWQEMNSQCGFAGTNVNDLYDKLGIQTTHAGYQYGWCSECTCRDILVNYTVVNLENGMGDVVVIEPAYDEFPYPAWYEY